MHQNIKCMLLTTALRIQTPMLRWFRIPKFFRSLCPPQHLLYIQDASGKNIYEHFELRIELTSFSSRYIRREPLHWDHVECYFCHFHYIFGCNCSWFRYLLSFSLIILFLGLIMCPLKCLSRNATAEFEPVPVNCFRQVRHIDPLPTEREKRAPLSKLSPLPPIPNWHICPFQAGLRALWPQMSQL